MVTREVESQWLLKGTQAGMCTRSSRMVGPGTGAVASNPFGPENQNDAGLFYSRLEQCVGECSCYTEMP